MPGCSLCMGNQARVAANSTVLSTSTRNFPNRLGDGANVYLTSAELASVGAILGKLPTPEEYMEYARDLDSMSDEIYRYMNFDQIVEFQKSAEEGARIAAVEIQEMRAYRRLHNQPRHLRGFLGRPCESSAGFLRKA